MNEVLAWAPLLAIVVAICSGVIATIALVETRRNNRASNAMVRLTNLVVVPRNYQVGLNFDLINSGRTSTTLSKVTAVHPRFKGLMRVEELEASPPRNGRQWFIDKKPINKAHTTSLKVELSGLSHSLKEHNSEPTNIIRSWLRWLLLSAHLKLVITLGDGKVVKGKVPIRRVNTIVAELRRIQDEEERERAERAGQELRETLMSLFPDGIDNKPL